MNKGQDFKHGDVVPSWTVHDTHWICSACNTMLSQRFPINSFFQLFSCQCGQQYRITWEESGDDASIYHHIYVDEDELFRTGEKS